MIRGVLAMALLLAAGCDGPVCEPGLAFCSQANRWVAKCDSQGVMKGYDCTKKCAEIGGSGPGFCDAPVQCRCADGKTWQAP